MMKEYQNKSLSMMCFVVFSGISAANAYYETSIKQDSGHAYRVDLMTGQVTSIAPNGEIEIISQDLTKVMSDKKGHITKTGPSGDSQSINVTDEKALNTAYRVKKRVFG